MFVSFLFTTDASKNQQKKPRRQICTACVSEVTTVTWLAFTMNENEGVGGWVISEERYVVDGGGEV